jgi:tetratricopeptide (TPR) repeat protein
VTATKQSLSAVLAKACDLQRKGLDAACATRQEEAARLVRNGIALLDTADPVERAAHDDWLRVRIRLLTSLAFIESEITGVADGLARLHDVRLLVEGFADPGVRQELTGPLEHNHGLLLMAAGRNEESVAHFDAALAGRENLMTGHPDAAVVSAYLGTLSTRGLAYTRVGDVAKARADLMRVIDLAERHELPEEAAAVRRPLGMLELRTGNVPAALRRYDEGERIYRALGLEVPELLRRERAQALLTAGLADEAGALLDDVLPALRELRSGTRELAQAELDRATAALTSGDLALARRLAAVARRRMRRWGCQTCVSNATIIGLHADTLEALRSGTIPPTLPARAVRNARTMSSLRLAEQAAVARLLAARLEIRRGNLDRAATLLGEVPRPGGLTPIGRRMLRRLCRAELAAANGNQHTALTEIRAGLSELDKVRDRMGALELVSATAVHGRELGDLAVRLLLTKSNPRRLFDWLERTRAQSYRYEPVADAPDPELADRVAEVRTLTQSIHQAKHDGHPTAALRARHAERLREAHRLGWRSGGWGRPAPVTHFGAVAPELGARALVSFAASEDELVAVVVAGGEIRTIGLGSAARAMESARMLHADLTALAPDNLPEPLRQVVETSAHRQAVVLDELLVRPLADAIEDRDLVIVPTGGLYAVPWGVLPGLRARPTVVAPSATAWLAADRADSSWSPEVVLVRGPWLPAARGEIDELAKYYDSPRLMSGEDATATSVLSALDGARLAHIAAHGAHEPENALFSRLELADGALFAHELTGLRKPPRQVVLAACELALNRIRPGDEALGFASALLAAGSRTVIAPLSKVGDHATAATMNDYHRALATGAAPAAALAGAIAEDPLRRPFVCLGTG